MNKSNKTFFFLYIAFICPILWLALMNGYQSFTCPKMTQTELFLRLGKSFILDFKECK